MDTKEEYRFLSAPYLIDRKLYKYYSNAKYAIDCIKNRRVHLDDPRTFNDPFDAAFHCTKITTLTSDDSDKELADKFLEYLCAVHKKDQGKKHLAIIQKYTDFLINAAGSLSTISVARPVQDVVQKVYTMMGSNVFSLDEFTAAIDNGFVERERVMRLNCKISCFSEICDSILMWSYYGNSHNGICVEFDLSLLDEKSELTHQIMSAMSKVHYSPIRADIQYSGSRAAELNFLTSKADVWEHEHEWRLICETETEYLPFDCISGVYVGVNFDTLTAKYRDLVKAVDTHESLSIRQCKLSLDRYQIESEEVYNSYMHTLLKRHKNEETSGQLIQIA